MKALRKLFSLLLVVPALTLVACDNDEPTDPTTNPSDTTTQNSEPEPEPEPDPEPEPEPDPSPDPDPDPEPEPEPEPNEYAISQIVEEGEYTVRGVVDAKTTVGAVIADNTGAIYVYGSDITGNLSIGDYVQVSGTTAEYGNFYQFTYSDATVDVLDEEPDFSLPDAVALTSTIVDSWSELDLVLPIHTVKYTWTTTATNSGSYVLLPVDGYTGSLTVEGVSVPSDFTFTDGWTYTVTAYFGGITSTRYANMYITDISEGEAPALESINITASGSTTIAISDTLQLTAAITPSGADVDIDWSTSAPNVATVSKTGLVTGVAVGSATITAKDTKTEISSTIDITVQETVEELAYVTYDVAAAAADFGTGYKEHEFTIDDVDFTVSSAQTATITDTDSPQLIMGRGASTLEFTTTSNAVSVGYTAQRWTTDSITVRVYYYDTESEEWVEDTSIVWTPTERNEILTTYTNAEFSSAQFRIVLGSSNGRLGVSEVHIAYEE